MQSGSGDDVGSEAVFEPGNLIFQRQFLLFQAPKPKLIATARRGQGGDCLVEVSVLPAQHFEFDAKHLFGFHRVLRVHDPASG